MTDERLSSLSILHIYNVVNVTKFYATKGEAPRLVFVNIPIQLKEERRERFKSFF